MRVIIVNKTMYKSIHPDSQEMNKSLNPFQSKN